MTTATGEVIQLGDCITFKHVNATKHEGIVISINPPLIRVYLKVDNDVRIVPYSCVEGVKTADKATIEEMLTCSNRYMREAALALIKHNALEDLL